MERKIPYSRQSIDGRDIRKVVEALKSDWLTQGPEVKKFEVALCGYTGAKYAVVVSSATAALHIGCIATGIKRGMEVITSPITFVASANSILYCGGKPVFADTCKETANIDPDQISRKISLKTKAIIPVHFAGHPCDLSRVRSIARKNKLIVIEDAAQALGASYKGTKIGSCKYSDMTVFSFHPVKSITTGEGGAILTNKRPLYDKLLMLRNHGITKQVSRKASATKPYRLREGSWYCEMRLLGYNYRLTDIQSAIGITQLKRLSSFIQKRQRIGEMYRKAFEGNEYFDIPSEKIGSTSAWHLYPIRLKGKYKAYKREIFEQLKAAGLGVQVHHIPVYFHPYYQNTGYKRVICPNAEEFYNKAISIPLYPAMHNKEVQVVIRTVLKVCRSYE